MTDTTLPDPSQPEPPSPRIAQKPTPVELDERFDGDDRKHAIVYACQMKWESLQPTDILPFAIAPRVHSKFFKSKTIRSSVAQWRKGDASWPSKK
jgi:hypothetical protein